MPVDAWVFTTPWMFRFTLDVIQSFLRKVSANYVHPPTVESPTGAGLARFQ